MQENKNFCPAPWTSLYFDSTGVVDNCCVAQNRIGNFNTDPIQKIIFSDKNKQIKQDMLDDKSVPGCKSCANKSHSLQTIMLEMMPGIDNPVYTGVDNFELGYLDARWSNTCNLACAYCSPGYSSQWASELGIEIKSDRGTKDKLLEYVLEQCATVKHIYLAGGEPLLMKENELLIDKIKDVNPNCSILVNTNLTQIKNSKIAKNLLEIKNCRWLVSVESMHDQFEYIRYPAVWSEFVDNLTYLKQHAPIHSVAFNMVLTALNGLEIWDTVDWLESQGFLLQHMSVTLYNSGAHNGPFNLMHLPKQHRDNIVDRMCSDSKYKQMAGWNDSYKFLTEGSTTDSAHELWKYLEQLDQRRGLDSKKTFSNIYQYK